MIECKVLSSLYYNIAPYPCFKGLLCEHKNCYSSPINRSWCRIIDLDSWLKSDFKQGEEIIIKRISENGLYDFNK